MPSRLMVFTLSVLLVSSLSGPGVASPRITAPTALQTNTGRLVGTVSGPDGVIAGAKVEATDNQTARVHTAVTTDEGTFEIPQLDFGTYTVKITAQGFKTFSAAEVKIDAAKEYSLAATLQVGNISETVTVTAGEDLLHVTSAELSNTVNMRQIQDLPLQGRNPLNLIGLQAGVSNNGIGDTVINGQRSAMTNITRDGINVQDNFIRANATDFLPDRPATDDVAEFTIVTQNADASSGYGTSQVNFVTPRGSNQFHGGAEITNRNSFLAANDFFNNAAGVKIPFLNRNQYGGKVGGPIIKDKLFFFVNVEFLKLRTSSQSLDTILLPQARGGTFTYVDNSGVTRTANVLSLAGASADPLIQSRILASVPTAGNTKNAGDQLNTTGLLLNRTANQDREAVTSRFDYEINSKQSFNAVYSYRHEFNQRPDVDNGGFTATPFSFQDANTNFVSAAHHWLLSSRLTNEIRGGFQFSDPKFDRTGQPTDFFITVPLITNPEVTFQKQGRNTQIWNFEDNATMLRGAHSLRFGGEFQAFRAFVYGPPAFVQSTIPTFALGTNTATPALVPSQFQGGISSTQLATANSLLALLGGIVGSASLQFNATSKTSGYVPGVLPHHNLNFNTISGYFTDQWRVTPRLTLNLGLRYDLFTPITEPNGLALEPVNSAGSFLASLLNPAGTYSFVGTNLGGNKFFRPQKTNFGPNVSFAYSPKFGNKWLNMLLPGGEGGGRRTVIRGGFSIAYANDEYVRASDNALQNNSGLSQGVALNPINARFQSLPAFQTPAFIVPRTYALNNQLAAGQGAVFGIDPNFQVPRTYQWTFGIERELGFKTALEIRYVGAYSNNLPRVTDFDQIDIFNNGFATDFNRARANFLLTGNAACTSAGCQPLTVFPHLAGGGLLNNSTIKGQLVAGTPADLAVIYLINGLSGTVQFNANPNALVVDLLANNAKFNYNSLQVEIRRRLAQGLLFQANYTFQKTLTNAIGTSQTLTDTFLDNNRPNLEYARADYDQTHVFNANFVYELPFGNGKRWLSRSGMADRFIGGWELTSIFHASTGPPITIVDPRGTLNRAGRSGRQTAISSLSSDQIQSLVGIFNAPGGVYWFNPANISSQGRGAPGFGQPAFPGEVFFNAAPGTTGNLPRAIFNGPNYFDWDAGIIKRIRIKESVHVQLRMEAFNALNHTNFLIGLTQNVNSASFGKITSTITGTGRIVQLVGRIDF